MLAPGSDENARNGSHEYLQFAPLLVANLNSITFDYVTRQKLQSTSLNWYIVEQLPVVPPTVYGEEIGGRNIGDFVKEQVLHLTFTAWDMKPFAEEMGYDGDPFVWDEEDRRHRRAKLDALYFHLYGLDEDDAAYILDTFPIVRRDDEKVFGRYRTKYLILGYLRAVKAGDLDVTVEA